MAFEQRELQGAIFKNDKGGNDKRPDYRGNVKVKGTSYKIAAWIKYDRKKRAYMTLALTEFTEEDKAREAARNNDSQSEQTPEQHDDILS